MHKTEPRRAKNIIFELDRLDQKVVLRLCVKTINDPSL